MCVANYFLLSVVCWMWLGIASASIPFPKSLICCCHSILAVWQPSTSLNWHFSSSPHQGGSSNNKTFGDNYHSYHIWQNKESWCNRAHTIRQIFHWQPATGNSYGFKCRSMMRMGWTLCETSKPGFTPDASWKETNCRCISDTNCHLTSGCKLKHAYKSRDKREDYTTFLMETHTKPLKHSSLPHKSHSRHNSSVLEVLDTGGRVGSWNNDNKDEQKVYIPNIHVHYKYSRANIPPRER